jgi:hypothetical protein
MVNCICNKVMSHDLLFNVHDILLLTDDCLCTQMHSVALLICSAICSTAATTSLNIAAQE